MQLKTPTADVGIIIGRFQINNIHDEHRKLIEFVKSRHKRVIIFVGYSPIPCTHNNPLPWRARQQMLATEFPNIEILFIKDVASDNLWSKRLDELIEDQIGEKTAILYGGRDSFLPYYKGKYQTQELMQDNYVSASNIRQELGLNTISSPDFRAGIIFATQNQYEQCFPTVDVAIMKTDYVLLVRKPNEEKWRFPGGFVKPGETWEQAAKREGMEETSLEFDELKYLGSFPIDDWRYRKEKNKITTTFFKAKYIFGGVAKGMDDVAEAKWFNVSELKENDFVYEHKVLFNVLKENL